MWEWALFGPSSAKWVARPQSGMICEFAHHLGRRPRSASPASLPWIRAGVESLLMDHASYSIKRIEEYLE